MTDLHCHCPHCQRRIHVKGDPRGRALVCPACKKAFAVSHGDVPSGPSAAVTPPSSSPSQHGISLSRVLLFGVLPVAVLVIGLASSVFWLEERGESKDPPNATGDLPSVAAVSPATSDPVVDSTKTREQPLPPKARVETSQGAVPDPSRSEAEPPARQEVKPPPRQEAKMPVRQEATPVRQEAKTPGKKVDLPIRDGPAPKKVVDIELPKALIPDLPFFPADKYLAYLPRPPRNDNDWSWRAIPKGMETDYQPQPLDPAIETIFTSIPWSLRRQPPPFSEVRDLQLDAAAGHLYWIDAIGNNGWLHRLNLDGSGLQNHVLPNVRKDQSLALDTLHKKAYWHALKAASTKHWVIMGANLDGTAMEEIVTGLDQPGAMAVDGPSNSLFYSDPGQRRIFRCFVDGSGQKAVIDNVRISALALCQGKLYWAPFGVDRVYRANFDGSQAERILDLSHGKERDPGTSSAPMTRIESFTVDGKNGEIYWRDHTWGIHRAKLDGTQAECLVSGMPIAANLTVDLEHGHLIWTERVFVPKVHDVSRIRRTKIPPLPQPVPLPAPPLITSIEPPKQTAGGKILLMGKGFTGTRRVAFTDLETGKHVHAEFEVRSDSELTVTVPSLSLACDRAPITVLTPGGATVTLPRDIHVLSKADGGFHQFDRPRATEAQLTIWLRPMTHLARLERALVYVCERAAAFPDRRGGVTLFVKNGAATGLRFAPRTVVYCEPFALVDIAEAIPVSTEVVRVPALRPSFVRQVFQYAK